VKAAQLKESKPYLGIDCMDRGTNDMRQQAVFETLQSKKSQMLLATQVISLILWRGGLFVLEFSPVPTHFFSRW
jgi:T-complex protein 1 subunit epsilon